MQTSSRARGATSCSQEKYRGKIYRDYEEGYQIEKYQHLINDLKKEAAGDVETALNATTTWVLWCFESLSAMMIISLLRLLGGKVLSAR